ncbi:MAG: ion transporter [Nevskiaceae bacterium]|nr:MAG: ion transporter [Nevskiaceae bacterium]TBR75098.1 MAG: ion transporter [Nevskiaceae bacterium]
MSTSNPQRLVSSSATRPSALDWLMLLLAVVSIALLVWEGLSVPDIATRQRITLADNSICAVFLVEFLYRWMRAGWQRSFLLRNWYDILGMIPISNPALRGLRLLRVVRIIVLLSRFGIAADRAIGEEFTYRIVNRFRQTLVAAISDTVTIAVMDQVADVLHKGTYTKNIVNALEHNEAELRQMVFEKLRTDPRTGPLTRLPFYRSVVDGVMDSIIDITRNILDDPRTDSLIADILSGNIRQLKEAVRANNAPDAATSFPSTPTS